MWTKNLARRRAICRFIAEFCAAHNGNGPSRREIANAIGIRSMNHLQDYIKRLDDEGLLTREVYIARSVRLTQAGEALAHEEEPDAPPAA